MSIKKLYKDIFERIEFLDKNVNNPFLSHKKDNNPFENFYNGTYVWIEEPENEPKSRFKRPKQNFPPPFPPPKNR